MGNRHLQALTTLLAEEHTALTTGALDLIPKLTTRKEDLLKRLTSAGATAQELSAISRDIARNQVLLEAAMNGVKAAESTLRNLQEPRGDSLFYDKSGAVSRLGRDGKGLSQKL